MTSCPEFPRVDSDSDPHGRDRNERAQEGFQERGPMAAERGRTFFHLCPVALWVEDFSRVKAFFQTLEEKGVSDFRTYFRKHPEKVVWLAEQVRVIEVNAKTLEMYQAKSLTEIEQGLSLVFNKQSYDVFANELIAFAQGKTTFSAQTVNQSLKGRQLHILLECQVVPGHEHDLSRVIVATQDISDLMVTHSELVESEEKYRKIFQDGPSAALLADGDSGIILEANRKAAELLGKPADEIAGMHLSEMHPREHVSVYKRMYEKVASGDRMRFEDCVVSLRSGKRIPVAVTAIPMELGGAGAVLLVLQVLDKGVDVGHIRRDLQAHKKSPSISPFNRLSSREREILCLVANGLTSRQIAEYLCISEKTVETHRSRGMRKLGFRRIAELVRFSVTCGEIDLHLDRLDRGDSVSPPFEPKPRPA